MPELPEVEIVKEGLKKHLPPQLPILDILFWRKNIRGPLPQKTIKNIIGHTVVNIERRAKYILIEIADYYIISHLGMTGTWRVEESLAYRKDHDHVGIQLHPQKFLIYNDPRRFGVFDLIKKDNLMKDKRFSKLGVEPLTKNFNVSYFLEKSKNKKINVKQFIMDQQIVVGVGNIYASEALFATQISPLKCVQDLKKTEIEQLIYNIQKILKKSLSRGGSSISDYSGVDQSKGSYQNNHKVYGKKGQPCPKCSHPIFMQVISGRSTFWCVKCQKTPRKSHENQKTDYARKNTQKTSRTQRS